MKPKKGFSLPLSPEKETNISYFLTISTATRKNIPVRQKNPDLSVKIKEGLCLVCPDVVILR